MITLEYYGMCEGCKYADLELHPVHFIDGHTEWMVNCIHEVVCRKHEEEQEKQDDGLRLL